MTKSRKVAILGAGGHALSVADACASMGLSVVGFITQQSPSINTRGIPVVSHLADLDLNSVELALGIGSNFAREDAYRDAISSHPEARFTSVIHSSAWVSPHATIEQGCVVLGQSAVGPECIVREGSLINTGASLDHESVLEAFASLGPGAHTGGRVAIGQRSVIGLNAGILQGRSVGADSVIGAQSLVTSDIESGIVAVGSPARAIRTRQREDTYY